MKRKVLSVIILSLCLVFTLSLSVFASDADSASVPTKECSNEECDAVLSVSDSFCSKCGTQYVAPKEECAVCKDNNIESNFCPTCGKQIIKQTEFGFKASTLGTTVPIMCTGMLGIFIVTGIIIAIVLILNTTMTVIDNKKQNKENK